MPTAAILGASGYAGQETLDRVLAHPELELVALGSDSLAARRLRARRPAERAPAGVRAQRRGARRRRRRDLRLPRERGGRGARASGRRGRRRSLGRAPAAGRLALSGLVRVRAPAAGCARRVELRRARARAAGGPARREPGLLRDGDAARARADRRPDRPGLGRRRREVGRVGRGPRARRRRRTPASCSRTSRPTASARTSTRRRSSRRSASPSASSRTSCPCGAGLLVTCYVDGDGVAERLEDAYAGAPLVRVLPEGVAPELARVQGTDTAELGVFEDRATGKTIVVCALDNLGKGAAARRCRTRTSRSA